MAIRDGLAGSRQCRLRAWVEFTALGVPDLTEIDRAFDVLARAATDGLIGMRDPILGNAAPYRR